MKRFRCKLPHHGTPWLHVEAKHVDEALDKAAEYYGFDDYAEMRKHHADAWGDDDGFIVELERGDT